MSLRPFFTYFGGKFRAAPKYPPPLHETIIEPFAGSAGYSLHYPARAVILIEKSHAIASIWRYLIGVDEGEILALPLLEPGQSVDSLKVPQEARWLIGMWVGSGLATPNKTMRQWIGSLPRHERACRWSAHVRARIADQLRAIRHWQVIEGDYSLAPDIEATWFVDAPYESMGRHYPQSAQEIDFVALAQWCRDRRGQVMVCESAEARWLPFRPLGAFKCNPAHGRKRFAEGLWLNDFAGSALYLPGETA